MKTKLKNIVLCFLVGISVQVASAQVYYKQSILATKLTNGWRLSDTNYVKTNTTILPATIVQTSGDKVITTVSLTTVNNNNQSKVFNYKRQSATSNDFVVQTATTVASRTLVGLKSLKVTSANVASTAILRVDATAAVSQRAIVYNCGGGGYVLYYEANAPISTVTWNPGNIAASLSSGIAYQYGSMATVTALAGAYTASVKLADGTLTSVTISGSTAPPNPLANAGLDQTASLACQPSYTFNITGVVTNAVGGSWQTAGDGVFANSSQLQTKYTFGTNDLTRLCRLNTYQWFSPMW